MSELIEELVGQGTIRHKGNVIATRVPYRVEVTQEYMEIRSFDGVSRVPAMGSIDGGLDMEALPAGGFSLMGEPIELVLEDGRIWGCFIQNSNGNLMNMSGMKTP